MIPHSIIEDTKKRHNEVSACDITAGRNMLASKGTQIHIQSITIRQGKTPYYTQQVTAKPEDPAIVQALYEVGTVCGMNGVSYEEFYGTKNIVNIQFNLRKYI